LHENASSWSQRVRIVVRIRLERCCHDPSEDSRGQSVASTSKDDDPPQIAQNLLGKPAGVRWLQTDMDRLDWNLTMRELGLATLMIRNVPEAR
jgi:hypothetical protein